MPLTNNSHLVVKTNGKKKIKYINSNAAIVIGYTLCATNNVNDMLNKYNQNVVTAKDEKREHRGLFV